MLIKLWAWILKHKDIIKRNGVKALERKEKEFAAQENGKEREKYMREGDDAL